VVPLAGRVFRRECVRYNRRIAAPRRILLALLHIFERDATHGS